MKAAARSPVSVVAATGDDGTTRTTPLSDYRNIGIMAHIDAGKVYRLRLLPSASPHFLLLSITALWCINAMNCSHAAALRVALSVWNSI